MIFRDDIVFLNPALLNLELYHSTSYHSLLSGCCLFIAIYEISRTPSFSVHVIYIVVREMPE